MSEQLILKSLSSQGVATITLNRPNIFNGYNEEFLIQLQGTISELESDTSVRVITLRGAGKHFSAGADVNWFKELAISTPEVQLAAARLSTGAMRALNNCKVPTIAMIHNACFGGGTGYAAACDIVIASEDARFAITEVRVGITPAPIMIQLINAIGVRQMRRYALTAETFDVREAKAIGLVHEICAVGSLEVTAAPIIDQLLRGGPKAIRDTKALIAEVGDGLLPDEEIDKMAGISAAGRSTPEGIEGFQAFLEKRSPNWYPRDE